MFQIILKIKKQKNQVALIQQFRDTESIENWIVPEEEERIIESELPNSSTELN